MIQLNPYVEVYSNTQLSLIDSEFSRLKEEYYLEHVGATLYSDVQISNIFENLRNNLYGNPHAYNISSKFTGDAVDQIRYQILDHFNTNPEEYDIIFTSGATAALKLVAETFQYENSKDEFLSSGKNSTNGNGTFAYLEDNHTSVLGMREYNKNVLILSNDNAFELFNNENINIEGTVYNNNSLFVYPAQCNFSGTKYPLSWIKKVQNGALNHIKTTNQSNWFCMLDAASFVSSNKLDLNIYKPDFICLSFYKIFGYPTGLGALLVKNSSSHVLEKVYFGGGTVQMTLPTEYIFRTTLHERFEDGTLPFLSILSIRHGFETFSRLNLNMDIVSDHTFSLAKYVHNRLLLMHHENSTPVALLYHDTNFENREHQGGIDNFNLLRNNGEFIGYSEVLQVANLYKIHLRTGCFCNPGACQRHLKLSPEDVKQHFEAGHVCGDQNDLINGYPTGSVRISFGYMSTKRDADKFLEMIENCFITKPIIYKVPEYWENFERQYKKKFSDVHLFQHKLEKEFKETKQYATNTIKKVVNINQEMTEYGELKHIFIYPIKSCGAFSISKNWTIEPTGLKFDREWMIVTAAGVCLTQKQEPNLCLIKPDINEVDNVLQLSYLDFPNITIPLDINQHSEKTEITLCQSKVCGDRVKCFDCGDNVADWLSKCLNRSNLRLLKQAVSNSRTNRKGEISQLSLANQAQYLILNIASVKHLASSIPDFNYGADTISNLLSRFRANFIINCDTPYIENECESITIGNFRFKCLGPCTRCQMICIDQQTAEKSVEPLRTLSVLTKGKIKFGVYLTKIDSINETISLSEKVIFK